ncbi:molecular chaperone TorD family protein [Vibrio sp. ZSDE26]|uniref:Molecular chaperone TorD family protein n=1 Tax=Vibrio amylolyticus TaxID=2847292 RepID=A0A9X1XSY3_9VIBR|nr:molecular chaperone TorD family protein [Vibrio amylolyticus]MCK6264984.1 molecular chaperone TorD family protein [Vibrio amylolyticus]
MDNQYQTLRADIYLLLSTLFRQAPRPELIEFLSTLDIEAEDSIMQQAWTSIRQAARECELESVSEEYQNLFIGIGRGEAVLFGSWHMTGSLMEKPLALLRHDLQELGYERGENVKEPEDHISALCEVMALLAQGDEDVQQKFFNDHIAPWYPSFTQQVSEAKHAKFYIPAAELLNAFLHIEQVRFSEKVSGAKSKLNINVNNISNSL